MKKTLFYLTVVVLLVAVAFAIATACKTVSKVSKDDINLRNQLDSLELILDMQRRTIASQRWFFERTIAGKYQYMPALDACRMAFKGHVEFETMYLPDSVIFRIQKIDDEMRERMKYYAISADSESGVES